MTTITTETLTDEIIESLRALANNHAELNFEPDTFTRPELQGVLSCSSKTALKKIRQWVNAGFVIPDYVKRPTMHGLQKVKGYRLQNQKEAG